jgi:hypothetical protein
MLKSKNDFKFGKLTPLPKIVSLKDIPKNNDNY